MVILFPNRIFKITAYCPTGNRTATGIVPYEGICAVDPKVISLHSIVYVRGLGNFKAEDTGVKGYSIDIFLNSCKKAKKFGVQWRRAKCLTKKKWLNVLKMAY
jgi:3D (Asp-Asp-Asp) domain-containing protein